MKILEMVMMTTKVEMMRTTSESGKRRYSAICETYNM